MISVPLTDVKKADLEAELTLYREGGIADVAEFGFLSNNAARIAEIERLRALHGHPVKLDKEFIDENAELVAVVEASGEKLEADDSIVFFSEADVSAAEEQKALKGADVFEVTQEHFDTNPFFADFATKAGVKVGDKVMYDPAVVISREEAIARGIDVSGVEAGHLGAGLAPKKEPEAPKKDATATEQASSEPDLVYLKKTVVRTENVLLNGKSYKDVTVATGETFRITLEEFDRDVKPRA